MWTDLPHPAVVAHRGDGAHAPENTISAFLSAVERRADAIEFDVKLTSDGQVVVIHDRTVDRTTDGKGKVSDRSLGELKNLDAGSWYSDAFHGERIPTLDEVFETVGKRIHMNVELTNYATPWDALVTKVVELVRKHAVQSQIIFSSFLPGNLRRASRLIPEIPCGLLALPGWMGIWGRTFGWRKAFLAVHPYFSEASAGLIDQVHAAGKLVNVWTVDSETDIKNMIGLGVDAIITDDPGLVLQMLGKYN